MEKGLFEKAGPALVIGTVVVLCGAAVWLLLSRGDEGRVSRGGNKQASTDHGSPVVIPKGLPLPGTEPKAVNPGTAPGKRTSNIPMASPGVSKTDPDSARPADVPTFNQPNMDGPPIDRTYYPGPDPVRDRDPNVPDGPPKDTQTYPGPPPYQPQPGQQDGPPMNGPDNPNQGPPQNQPGPTPNGPGEKPAPK